MRKTLPPSMATGRRQVERVSRLIARMTVRILDDNRLNHQVRVESGLLANECATLLKDFFARLRGRPS